jgi:ABC-type glycerol-3-phosphate transport system permease component
MVVPPITLVVPMFVLMVDTGWINHLQSVIVFYTGSWFRSRSSSWRTSSAPCRRS